MITYPYIPEGRVILYAPASNEWMRMAKEFARENNTVRHIHAAILVKDGKNIGKGSIGGGYHGEIDPSTGSRRGCAREHMNIPTGTRYDLCKGCGSEYHSEHQALTDAKTRGNNPAGANLYLWGHWWCCESCWRVMIDTGIKDVYLLEGSEILFNKTNAENIIGRQFE